MVVVPSKLTNRDESVKRQLARIQSKRQKLVRDIFMSKVYSGVTPEGG